MLSKEEIEDSIENKFNDSEEENFVITVEEAKHIALYEKEIHYCDALTQATYNILLQYIEQLESDEQKLIEKLEEDIEKCKKENAPYEEYNKESRMYWLNIGKIQLAEKILKIVKGENNE